MDKKEFMKRFQKKVDEAKQNYENSLSKERRKVLAELKEKIISEAQEKFLDSIPPIIAPGEKPLIEYRITAKRDNEGYDDVLYNIKGVLFGSSAQTYNFIENIVDELSEMIGREICCRQENFYRNCIVYALNFYID